MRANLLYAFVIVLLSADVSICIHIKGKFRVDDFFKFLIKFGVQKTDRHQKEATRGYVFGNITSNQHFHNPIFLTILDKYSFEDFYNNRDILDRKKACRRMFTPLKTIAFHSKCNYKGSDYFRKVPCPTGKLCEDEDLPSNVVRGHQFTYIIQTLNEPSFWYLSIAACHLNESTCEWEYSDIELRHEIEYDIWLVNGNPNFSTSNDLTYQFSFDHQNTIEFYIIFWLVYMILVPLQMYAARIQKHPATRLFTASLLLEFLALCLILVDKLKFALDGIGFPKICMAGDILDIFSRTLFMLLLLLLAKGWAVTRMELTWKPVVFAVWICYGIVHILLYVWNLTEVDVVEDIDEYQTWPGWLILVFRTLIMFWFLYELRTTMLYEHNMKKLNFLLHFGALSLVWFIYLPILAFIALHISALWRYKLIIGITYSADCFAYCVMAHLLWPTRSEQYFLLAGATAAELEELDEFNEAPHVINRSLSSFSSLSSLDITRYEEEKKIKVNT